MDIISKANIAFAYECKFSELVELIHGTKFKVQPTSLDTVYVTGISQDNFIEYETRMLLAPNVFDKFSYAKLAIELERDLQGLLDISVKKSRNGIFQEEQAACPIFRFKKNIPYMDELGIMPWHHLLFVGKYIFVYIWDTRLVEKVLTIEETDRLSVRMLKLAKDNNAPLQYTAETEQYRDYFDIAKKSLHPCIRKASVVDELTEGGYDINESSTDSNEQL